MTRRKFLGAVAVVGAGSAAGLEGFLVEPHSLEVTHHKVGREDPSGGPTLRIVQITDLHLEDVNDHVVRVAEAVNRSLPDIVTITGDSVNGARGLGALGDFLDLLASGPPKYAIYGNWERWAGIDPGDLGATYEARNGRLLVNESVVHQQGGAEVLI
ncbi:MAG: metallophosphoesterase, partial [Gemmatimonadetes bacterium]|nr:metallophosphoesterase [Gemmatimonadota bacterium]